MPAVAEEALSCAANCSQANLAANVQQAPSASSLTLTEHPLHFIIYLLVALTHPYSLLPLRRQLSTSCAAHSISGQPYQHPFSILHPLLRAHPPPVRPISHQHSGAWTGGNSEITLCYGRRAILPRRLSHDIHESKDAFLMAFDTESHSSQISSQATVEVPDVSVSRLLYSQHRNIFQSRGLDKSSAGS